MLLYIVYENFVGLFFLVSCLVTFKWSYGYIRRRNPWVLPCIWRLMPALFEGILPCLPILHSFLPSCLLWSFTLLALEWLQIPFYPFPEFLLWSYIQHLLSNHPTTLIPYWVRHGCLLQASHTFWILISFQRFHNIGIYPGGCGCPYLLVYQTFSKLREMEGNCCYWLERWLFDATAHKEYPYHTEVETRLKSSQVEIEFEE